MNKKVGIITMDSEAGQIYAEEIRESFGESIEILLYNIEEQVPAQIRRADIYLVSTSAIESCMETTLNLPIGVRVLDISVDFTLNAVEKLKKLPKGTKALFVNNSEFLVSEAVTRVQQLGIHHVEFYPYYPGIREIPPCSIAVTPGERELVPEGIETVIDLGHRKLTPHMMVEIALELNLQDALKNTGYQNYIMQFHMDSYRTLHTKLTKSLYLEDCFDVFIEGMDDGVIGVDENGEIFCFNNKAGDILERDASLMIGRAIEDELPFIPFSECRTNYLPVENTVKSANGSYIICSLRPILHDGKFRGIFAVIQRFTEAERKHSEARMKVLNKGHAAKYRFEHIIGQSQAIKKTKELAMRMALTDFTILIYGESGTGKELFASAIHNASGRAAHPYVAINCAAMPETLLESELFGYEDGAFTGAKKGGRIGLFELAHEGTVFLDEIENMSPALQVKLLRVLQEKEIMRVGGHQTIGVDVRIIAATNEDLEATVKIGSFRKDLYYRLSTLPIKLPLLSQRREDILILFDYFKTRYNHDFQISAAVRRALVNHHWDGNVRELQNCIEYFVCLGKDLIEIEDLPRQLCGSVKEDTSEQAYADALTEAVPLINERKPCLQKEFINTIDKKKRDQYLLVLSILRDGYKNRIHLGRNTISDLAADSGVFLTGQEVRTILNHLQERDLVCISRGRSGSKLTAKGIELAESLANFIVIT